jgi:hypothetical protein
MTKISPINFFAALRSTLLSAALATCMFSQVEAQTTLVPVWSDITFAPNPAAGQPSFSNDGKEVLMWSPNSFEVYELPTATFPGGPLCLQTINTGSITSACMNGDGTVLYSVNSSLIYSYNIAARTQSQLPIALDAGTGARMMKVSKDGTKLLFVATDTLTNKDQISLYSIPGYAPLAQFDYAPGTTASIDFLGTANLLASGPTVYDLKGNVVGSSGTDTFPAVASLDGKSVYTWTIQSGIGSTPTLSAYPAGSLTPNWTAPIPSQAVAYGKYCLSSDGKALFFLSSPQGQGWSVIGFNTANGKALDSTLTVSIPSNMPFLASSPAGADLLLGPPSDVSYYAAYPYAYLYSANTSNGACTMLASLFEGQVSGSTFTAGKFTAKSSDQAAISIDELQTDNSVKTTVRNSDTGSVIGTLPVSGAVLDPTGQYFGVISSGGLTVFNVSSNLPKASYSAGRSFVQWGGSTLLTDSGGDPIALALGSTALTEINPFPYTQSVRLSPDGATLASKYGSTTTLYNVADAKVIGTETSPSNPVAVYIGKGVLVLQTASYGVNGPPTNTCQLYSYTATGITLLRTISIAVGTGSDSRGGYQVGGALSQDGKYLAIASAYLDNGLAPLISSTIRIYSVSTGNLIDRWDNQYLPDFGSFVFGVDDATLTWTCNGGVVSAPVGLQLRSFVVSPSSVVGGHPSEATIVLTSPAPAGGKKITLISTSAVTLPTSVTVPAGATSYSFSVPTNPVKKTVYAPITAALTPFAKTETLAITPAAAN